MSTPCCKIDAKVAESHRSLQQQDVVVIEVNIHNVDMHEELGNKTFKLKMKKRGVTRCKSEPWKSSFDLLPRSFDTTWSIICEGDGPMKLLQFELCQPRRLRSTQTVASGWLPLAEVLGSVEVAGGSRKRVYNLELESVTTPGKILAWVALDISAKQTTLEAAGGLQALKVLRVPPMPKGCKTSSDNRQLGTAPGFSKFQKHKADCKTYIEQSAALKHSLQSALDTAMMASRLSPSTNREELWQKNYALHKTGAGEFEKGIVESADDDESTSDGSHVTSCNCSDESSSS